MMLAHPDRADTAYDATLTAPDTPRGELRLRLTLTCWHASYVGRERLLLGSMTEWWAAGAWTPSGPAGQIPVAEDDSIPRLRIRVADCQVTVRRDGPTLGVTLYGGRTPADVLPRLLAILIGRGLIVGWGSSDASEPRGVTRLATAMRQRSAAARARATGGRPEWREGEVMAARLIAEERARMTAIAAVEIDGRRHVGKKGRTVPATPDRIADEVERARTRLQTALRDTPAVVGTGSERTRRRRAAALVNCAFWPETHAPYRDLGSGHVNPAKIAARPEAVPPTEPPCRVVHRPPGARSPTPSGTGSEPRRAPVSPDRPATQSACVLQGQPAVPSRGPADADGGGAPDRPSRPATQPAGTVRGREDAGHASPPLAADRARTGGRPTAAAGDTARRRSRRADATASVTARKGTVIRFAPRRFKSMGCRSDGAYSDSYLFRQLFCSSSRLVSHASVPVKLVGGAWWPRSVPRSALAPR